MNQQIHGLPNGEWGWGSKGGENNKLVQCCHISFCFKIIAQTKNCGIILWYNEKKHKWPTVGYFLGFSFFKLNFVFHVLTTGATGVRTPGGRPEGGAWQGRRGLFEIQMGLEVRAWSKQNVWDSSRNENFTETKKNERFFLAIFYFWKISKIIAANLIVFFYKKNEVSCKWDCLALCLVKFMWRFVFLFGGWKNEN